MQASPHPGQRPKIAAGKPQDDRHTTPHCFLLPTLESLSLPARFKGPGVTTRAWSFHEFSSLNLKSSLPASENPNHRCEHLLSPGCLEASSHPHMEELPAPTSTSAPCRARLYKFFTLLLTASVEEENRENVAVPTHRTGSRLGVRAGAVTNTHTHTHPQVRFFSANSYGRSSVCHLHPQARCPHRTPARWNQPSRDRTADAGSRHELCQEVLVGHEGGWGNPAVPAGTRASGHSAVVGVGELSHAPCIRPLAHSSSQVHTEG